MLKYTNNAKIAAQFHDTHFSLKAAEDWNSIGDGPVRDAVLAWLAEGNVPEPADSQPAYRQLRALAYPPIPDQLDLIFHQGLEGWRTVIQAVKTKYPKPS